MKRAEVLLQGPVVAAAVILDPKRPIEGLNDSKKLSEKKRAKLSTEIKEKALYWAIAQSDPDEIEQINILWATMKAMQRSVEALPVAPSKVLIDGNRVPELNVPAEAIVGGDASEACIAAASILAKVERDGKCSNGTSAIRNTSFISTKLTERPPY